ncbi:MAG: NAD(+)/NADH kinase [Candidatus Marinimicrobia bacterium]|nr:NAD(+)/NADH kinase [Candidatus Neomarinimicrobiota bacterium]
MKIGLQLHPHIRKSKKALKEILQFLIDQGQELYISQKAAQHYKPLIKNINYTSVEECVGIIDVMLCIGGDGTFLGGLRRIRGTDIPILGIHLGGLGFLADLSLEDYQSKLRALFEGNYEIDERYSLEAETYPAVNDKKYRATNEFHIAKGNVMSMIKIKIFVDDEYLNTYRADGLLVSSPTGSTAYGLSAGGPIISPGLDIMAISPICPHSLSARPVIISGEQEVKIDCSKFKQDESLVIDGTERVSLKSVEDVIVRRSDETFKIIRFKEESFFKTLRKKLNWGIDSRGN